MLRRVNKEVLDWSKDHPSWATLDKVNIDASESSIDFTIIGPEDTPYHNGIFKIKALIPPDYPFKRPSFKFETKIYHPNIGSTGSVCCCLIPHLESWSPAHTILTCIAAIYQVLIEPNVDHMCDKEISDQF